MEGLNIDSTGWSFTHVSKVFVYFSGYQYSDDFWRVAKFPYYSNILKNNYSGPDGYFWIFT